MEIQQLVDKNEGKLIYIKRRKLHYIASSLQGLIKFNFRGEVTELGLNHNNTVLMQSPLKFQIESCDNLVILKQTTQYIGLKNGTLVIKKSLKTNYGKLKSVIDLDVNDNGELVFGLAVNLTKQNLWRKIDDRVSICFNVIGDYVENYNDSVEQLVSLNCNDEKAMLIQGVQNVQNITILPTENGAKCVITSDKIVRKKRYLPAKFKIKMIKM